MFPHNSINIAGFPIASIDLEDATKYICKLGSEAPLKEGIDIHLMNASSVYYAEQDPQVREMYSESSVLLPDGKSFEIASGLLGRKLQQVRGPSLFNSVFDVGRSLNINHFLLGTTVETLTVLKSNLEMKYPGVSIVGVYSPPFSDFTEAELQAQTDAIKDSGAQIVWVGMSSPKQDFLCQKIARELGLVTLGVGAAFDFAAGTQKEAPRFFQRIGLEWLYRLLSNPRRMWKRYLVGNFVFIATVIKLRNKTRTFS